MKELGVGGDDDKNGDCPLVDVIGGGSGDGSDGDSNKSRASDNKTDKES